MAATDEVREFDDLIALAEEQHDYQTASALKLAKFAYEADTSLRAMLNEAIATFITITAAVRGQLDALDARLDSVERQVEGLGAVVDGIVDTTAELLDGGPAR